MEAAETGQARRRVPFAPGGPRKVPVLLCIDVEPDPRLVGPGAPGDWTGFERCVDRFEELRRQLRATTGCPVHFSWFLRMDPQISEVYRDAAWVVGRYRSLIQRISSAGDALGLHVHPWRWDERGHRWVLDVADPAWVNHSVRLAFRAFRGALGQSCREFRFGDRWMSNATVALLERLGARVDLTLEPGQRAAALPAPARGARPDYRAVPQRAYRPSRMDYTRPGVLFPRRLWMVPLSAGSPDAALPAATRRAEAHGSLSSVAGAGVYEGCLDRVDGEIISGWAYDARRPDAPVAVEICDGDALLATGVAATFRPDLLAAGKGNGRHCFNLAVPGSLRDGRPHEIRVMVAGTGFLLSNCPAVVTCPVRDAPSDLVTLNLGFASWTVRAVIDQILGRPEPGHLAMVLRSDVLIHADQCSNMEHSLDRLLSGRSAADLVFERPDELIARVAPSGSARQRAAVLKPANTFRRWCL